MSFFSALFRAAFLEATPFQLIKNILALAFLVPVVWDAFRGLSRLGKYDRWIVQYLLLASVVLAVIVATTGFVFDGNAQRIAAIALMVILMLRSLLLPPRANPHQARAAMLVIVFVCVAILNSTVSWNWAETSMRWIAWFGLVFALTKLARTSVGEWVEAVIRLAPLMLLMLYFAYIVLASKSEEVGAMRWSMHMSGLYANLIVATGLFANKLWVRTYWVVFGLLWVYTSGAGGALFTVPIMFIPFILYSTTSMPVKGMALALLLIVGTAVFFKTQLFTRFLDIKLNISPNQEGSFSGMDRLQRSKDMRLGLAIYGWELANKHPFGTGLGNTYKERISEDRGVGHVHDGFVSLLIELGYPGFVAFATVAVWVLLSILRNPEIPNRYKGFYFTYAFTIAGRALSENLTIFDLGTFFNILFLFFTCYLFMYPRRHSVHAGSELPPRNMPPPMRPPPPFARPPMPWPRPASAR